MLKKKGKNLPIYYENYKYASHVLCLKENHLPIDLIYICYGQASTFAIAQQIYIKHLVKFFIKQKMEAKSKVKFC